MDVFDQVFWLGDLNYRVDLDRALADQHVAGADWMVGLLSLDTSPCSLVASFVLYFTSLCSCTTS